MGSKKEKKKDEREGKSTLLPKSASEGGRYGVLVLNTLLPLAS